MGVSQCRDHAAHNTADCGSWSSRAYSYQHSERGGVSGCTVTRCEQMVVDEPKTLRDPKTRELRLSAVDEPHVALLTAFVHELRAEMGPDFSIPYFDPADGGTTATLLYLLEAPGPRAIASGFVSRDNPDETAKNFLLLNQEAGIDRRRTVIWNIVPWYIGSGTRIRAASGQDTEAGARSLERLLNLLPRLRCAVFLGAHAAKAGPLVARLRPGLETFTVPHPSPMFVNRAPGNWGRILSVLRTVAGTLPE